MHAQSLSCVSQSLIVQHTFSVWPCDLLIDIAKHGLTGSWTLLNWNGSSLSDGIKGVHQTVGRGIQEEEETLVAELGHQHSR